MNNLFEPSGGSTADSGDMKLPATNCKFVDVLAGTLLSFLQPGIQKITNAERKQIISRETFLPCAGDFINIDLMIRVVTSSCSGKPGWKRRAASNEYEKSKQWLPH